MFEYNNKTYKLRYDFNAIADIEELSGKSIDELQEDKKGFYNLRIMLWGGLLHDNNNMTIRLAGEILNDLIEKNNIEHVIKLIHDAVQKCGIFKNEKTDSGE